LTWLCLSPHFEVVSRSYEYCVDTDTPQCMHRSTSLIAKIKQRYNCCFPISACRDSPCRHGGTCVPGARGGFTCACPGGWRGRVCEVVYTPTCDPGPCLNNGTCRLDPHAPRGYRCHCPDDGAVYGENCEARTSCRYVAGGLRREKCKRKINYRFRLIFQ